MMGGNGAEITEIRFFLFRSFLCIIVVTIAMGICLLKAP